MSQDSAENSTQPQNTKGEEPKLRAEVLKDASNAISGISGLIFRLPMMGSSRLAKVMNDKADEINQRTSSSSSTPSLFGAIKQVLITKAETKINQMKENMVTKEDQQ